MTHTYLPLDHVGNYKVIFLDAMYRARRKVKVSCAQRHRPSTSRRAHLSAGNTAFYFESLEIGKGSLHGPAVVIGADGDFVALRQGGSVRRIASLLYRSASVSCDLVILKLWRHLRSRNGRWTRCLLTKLGVCVTLDLGQQRP